jgi:hypothetical protein
MDVVESASSESLSDGSDGAQSGSGSSSSESSTRSGDIGSDSSTGKAQEKHTSDTASQSTGGVSQELDTDFDVVFSEMLEDGGSLREKSILARTTAVVRYLVDLLWVTLWCSVAVVGALLLLAEFVYVGDPSEFRTERGILSGEWWPLFMVDEVFLTFAMMVGLPGSAMWWQIGWKSGHTVFLVYVGVSIFYYVVTSAAKEAMWTIVDKELMQLITLVVILVYAYPSLNVAALRLEKNLDLPKYRRAVMLSFFALSVSVGLYFAVVPPLFLAMKEDWERALLRVLLHPLLWEISLNVLRLVATTQLDPLPDRAVGVACSNIFPSPPPCCMPHTLRR